MNSQPQNDVKPRKTVKVSTTFGQLPDGGEFMFEYGTEYHLNPVHKKIGQFAIGPAVIEFYVADEYVVYELEAGDASE